MRILRLLKYATWVVIILFILSTGSIFYLFQANKTKIELLLKNELNKSVTGSIDFKEIDIDFFSQFPFLSISVHDLSFEQNIVVNKSDRQLSEVLFKEVNIRFDLFNIVFQRKLELSNTNLIEGDIQIRTYRPKQQKTKTKPKKKTSPPTTTPMFQIEFDFSNVALINSKIQSFNDVLNHHFSLQVKNLDFNKKREGDIQNLFLDGDFFLDQLVISNRNIPVSIDGRVKLNAALNSHDNLLHFRSGNIVAEKTKVDFKGDVNLSDDWAYDLTFHATDESFNISQLILTDRGINNFKKGSIKVSGFAKQADKKSIPQIGISLDAKNIEIDIPEFDSEIKDLNLHLTYDMGSKSDLSESVLTIDTVYGILPDGYINGHCTIKGLSTPVINANIQISSDLEKIFKIIDVSPLILESGHFQSRFACRDLKFEPKTKWPSFRSLNARFSLKALKGNYKTIQMDNMMTDLTIESRISNELVRSLPSKEIAGFMINPKYKTLVDGNASMQGSIGLDNWDDSSSIKDVLDGVLSANINIGQIEINTEQQKLNLNQISSKIELKNVGIKKDGVCHLDSINGSLDLFEKNMSFNNIRGKFLSSDFKVDGQAELRNDVYYSENALSTEFELSSELINLSEIFNFYGIDISPEEQVKNVNGTISISQLNTESQIFDVSYKDLKGEYELLKSSLSIPSGNIHVVIGDTSTDVTMRNDEILFEEGTGHVNAKFTFRENMSNEADLSLGLKKVNTIAFTGQDEKAQISLETEAKFAFESKEFLDFKNVRLKNSSLIYSSPNHNCSIVARELKTGSLTYNSDFTSENILQFEAQLEGYFDQLSYANYSISNQAVDLSVKNGRIAIRPIDFEINAYEIPDSLIIVVENDYNSVSYHKHIDDLDYANLIRNFEIKKLVRGKIDLDIFLKYTTNSSQSIYENVDGNILVQGNDLKLYGLNFDQILKKYDLSRKYNFAGVGTLFFLGPIAYKYREVENYNDILTRKRLDSTTINYMHTELNISNGKIDFKDVAFRTSKYRLAIKGTYHLGIDQIDLTSSIVDWRGCSMIDQSIIGKSTSYQIGKTSFKEIHRNPVTKAYENYKKKNCIPFYSGKVEPMGQKKSKAQSNLKY